VDVRDVGGRAVGQPIPLEVALQQLDGVEPRGEGRQGPVLVDRGQDGVQRAGDIHRGDAVVEELESVAQESSARRACR